MPPPASSPSAFAWRFVWIYFLAQLCEYLQGPFMFAAYRQYHSLPLERVGLLFFTSSLSNALSGCLLAPLGDAHDRRLGCVFFCLLSVAACALTRAALPFSWLILGRLLGGGATNLLETSFEALLICDYLVPMHALLSAAEEGLPTERHPRQAPKEGLTSPNLAFQETRLSATTEATTTARRETVEGLLLKAPQGSLPSPDRPLTAVSPPEAFQHALHLFASQSEVRLCGLLQVAFEAPLDLFVLLWTPGIPQQMNPGIAFAALMGGLATGSYLFCHVGNALPPRASPFTCCAGVAQAVGSLCAYSFGGTSSSEEAATNKAGRSTF
ncbi:molybdate-anion transporter [Cyclospora cayetanensis]|uniref:Molybdate-anion transporter n=1 Tax=Cyclospora cayetanensis TaxID=88456 RepID=A0A6P6RPX3_9EIME|nr:molybdate-anion transporter [Cyclospora cayetanensis]